MWEEGDSVFFRGPSYIETLTVARMGNIPFYLLFTGVVWLWGCMLLGRPAAALATAFSALAPPVLGHAALATTDMGLAATVVLALYAMILWLERPTTLRAALVGTTSGLALTAKFSAIPYLGLCLLFFSGLRLWNLRRDDPGATDAARAGWQRWRTPATRQALAAAAAFALVVWAVYRFSIVDLHGVPVPAGEVLRGMKDASRHSLAGHYAYLLGERSKSGWWYYFPVVFAVKTPLVLLLLGSIGAVSTVRRWRGDWRLATPLLVVLSVLITGVVTNINIGVRHILPLYAAWAVLAAAGALALWRPGRLLLLRRVWVIGALTWFTIDVIKESPYLLSYFNEISRRDPGSLLVDSNLDWGQDMLRLADELTARGITEISVSMLARPVFGKLTSARVRRLAPGETATGWVAVSETCLRNVYPDICGGLDWLTRQQPVTRVGRSILLYRVPDTPPSIK
jgi:4-amino-4-deoxy-L-arabinose transferase-like glycosyltransferase